MTHNRSTDHLRYDYTHEEPAVFVPVTVNNPQEHTGYQQLFRAWQEQRNQLEKSYASIIVLLADIMEAKDPSTHTHCNSVARHAIKTAVVLKLDIIEQSIVYYSALLHDIGKIGIRDDVLNKPGPLTADEREHMRLHVRLGYNLLAPIPTLSAIANVVLHHHEWYDGTGYPDGLVGAAIPLAARIISVVDAYGAMTSERSYKKVFSDEYARTELRTCCDTQFDPNVVDAFIRVLDDEGASTCTIADVDERRLLPTMVNYPIFQQMHG